MFIVDEEVMKFIKRKSTSLVIDMVLEPSLGG